MAEKVDIELVELVSGIWGETLQTLARECTGGAAAVRSSGAGGSPLRPTSPRYRPLMGLRYDEARREVEVSIGLDRGARPSLRYFVSAPRRIFLSRGRHGRALIVLDASGVRTWIQLAAAGEPRARAAAGPAFGTPCREAEAIAGAGG